MAQNAHPREQRTALRVWGPDCCQGSSIPSTTRAASRPRPAESILPIAAPHNQLIATTRLARDCNQKGHQCLCNKPLAQARPAVVVESGSFSEAALDGTSTVPASRAPRPILSQAITNWSRGPQHDAPHFQHPAKYNLPSHGLNLLVLPAAPVSTSAASS